MMRWLCRLFGLCRDTVRPKPIVGIVCHRLNNADVSALRAMGVRHVRLSLYENSAGAEWIDRALTEGFDVLEVVGTSDGHHTVPKEREQVARSVSPLDLGERCERGEPQCLRGPSPLDVAELVLGAGLQLLSGAAPPPA